MGSRANLSLLAALSGAALMYAVLSFLGGMPGTTHTGATTAIILLILACICIGWVRIFSRRPNPRAGDE